MFLWPVHVSPQNTHGSWGLACMCCRICCICIFVYQSGSFHISSALFRFDMLGMVSALLFLLFPCLHYISLHAIEPLPTILRRYSREEQKEDRGVYPFTNARRPDIRTNEHKGVCGPLQGVASNGCPFRGGQ
jgi:hypothetical protein